MILSAVALTLAAVSQVKAGEALLPPRAQGNQIHKVSGMNNDPDLVAQRQMAQNGASLSPRALGNQITKVTGTNNDRDLVAELQGQDGSPHNKSVPATTAPTYQIAPVK